MILNSQRDPKFKSLTLGASRLPVSGYGCFVMSVANLYQVDPSVILNGEGAFNAQGLLFPASAAKLCGGIYDGVVTKPKGWVIGMTADYAPQFPTHFVCVNPTTKQMIDPLKFPSKVEPLTYNIKEYRGFAKIKLDTTPVPAGPFKDVPAGSEGAEEISWAKDQGIFRGDANGNFNPDAPLTRRQAAMILYRQANI